MANIKLRVTRHDLRALPGEGRAGAARDVAGVYSAVVDLQSGEAEVDFEDDAVTTTQLVAAVETGRIRREAGG